MQMDKQTPVSPVQEIQLGTEDLLCFSMNIFGKNKAPSELPPEPPKRPDVQGEAVSPSLAEEEEEEALYIYEAPPREEPAKKGSVVQPQEPEEGTYLEEGVSWMEKVGYEEKGQQRKMISEEEQMLSQIISLSLDCPNLRRFSVPVNLHSKPCMEKWMSLHLTKALAHSNGYRHIWKSLWRVLLLVLPNVPSYALQLLAKPGAEDSDDEGTINIQALEEALKKGLMKSPQPPSLPPSARRVSLPASAFSGHQTKVAINNGSKLSLPLQDEPQDQPIYLECEASTGEAPSFGPIFSKDPDMKNAAWYAGNCDRRTAEAALLQFNKSSRRSPRQPFTLVVFYKNHIYNVPIHYQESSCQFALGKDGKSRERNPDSKVGKGVNWGHQMLISFLRQLFDSVSSIIQKYSERPLVLIDGSTSAKEQTCLLFPVTP
ncbi:hypothetical protein Chor_002242 [Crotalus horridus]